MKRARMQSCVWMVLLSASLLLLCGCPAKSMDLMAKPSTDMADIPLPTGFTRDVDRSHSFSNESGLRYVDHRYKGSAEPTAVVRFYVRQMPISGWKEPNKLLVQGRTTMDYVKGREKCRISIYGGTWNTVIEITIFPSGASPTR